MAPKLLCGLLLTLVGLVFSSFCFIYAVMNPWALTACELLGTQTLVPFIISTAAMCAGSSSASMWRSTRTIRIRQHRTIPALRLKHRFGTAARHLRCQNAR